MSVAEVHARLDADTAHRANQSEIVTLEKHTLAYGPSALLLQAAGIVATFVLSLRAAGIVDATDTPNAKRLLAQRRGRA